MSSLLTDREHAILDLVSQGFSNSLIGTKLNLSENTIKKALSTIYAKLGARDRAHATLIGVLLELVPLHGEGVPMKLDRNGHTLACVAAQTCPCRIATR